MTKPVGSTLRLYRELGRVSIKWLTLTWASFLSSCAGKSWLLVGFFFFRIQWHKGINTFLQRRKTSFKLQAPLPCLQLISKPQKVHSQSCVFHTFWEENFQYLIMPFNFLQKSGQSCNASALALSPRPCFHGLLSWLRSAGPLTHTIPDARATSIFYCNK